MIRLHRQRRIEHENSIMSVVYREDSLRTRLSTIVSEKIGDRPLTFICPRIEIPLMDSTGYNEVMRLIEDVVLT